MKTYIIIAFYSLVILSNSMGQGDTRVDQKENINYASTAPVIDGDTSEWAEVPAYNIQIDRSETSPDVDDVSGSFKCVWDEEFLYFLFKVKDDTLVGATNKEQAWKGDCIEIGVTYQLNDYYNVFDNSVSIDDGKFVMNYDTTIVMQGSAWKDSGDKLAYVRRDLDDGYLIEARITHNTVYKNKAISNGSWVLIEFLINDSEDGVNKKHCLGWSGYTNINSNPEEFGRLTFIGRPLTELTVLQCNEINLDSNFSEWENADSIPITLDVSASAPQPDDLSAYFKTAWDIEGMSFFIQVTDQTLAGTVDVEKPWTGDCIEMVFSFGVDDNYDVTNPELSNDDAKLIFNFNSAINVSGYQLKQDLSKIGFNKMTTENGYIIETYIPFTSIYSNPEISDGANIRFDIKVNDSENGIDNVHSIRWGGVTHINKDMSGFGVLNFSETELTLPTSININNNKEINPVFYPNPVSDILNINSNHPINSISIYTITGELLKEVDSSGSNRINMSDFRNGAYIVKLTTGKGEVTYHKIVKY